MPLCRKCRRSYTFKGDPKKAGDSRDWSAEERLCDFCLDAGRRRRRLAEPPRVPTLDRALGDTLRD